MVKEVSSEILWTWTCGDSGDASTRAVMLRDDGLAGEKRRLVEALAQRLYEASDPDGVSWAKRTRTVRDAWLLTAERQLSPPATDRTSGQ